MSALDRGFRMRFWRIVIKQAELAAIPAADRNLLLLLGHVLNELTIVLRVTTVSIQSIHQESGELTRASEGQAFFFLRLLGAKTHEAWEAFRTRFDGDPEIARRYGKALALKSDPLLKDARKKFSNNNFLSILRNAHAFHYPDTAEIDRAYQTKANAGGAWIWYGGPNRLNSYFHASDVVALAALDQATNSHKGDLEGLKWFMDEVLKVSGMVIKVLEHVIDILLKVHFAEQLQHKEPTEVFGLRPLRELELPYWTLTDSAPPT